MTIQAFLLARLDEDQAAAEQHRRPASSSSAYTPPGHFEEKRAIVHRHRDQLRSISSTGQPEYISTCAVCPKVAPRPCASLRILAQDYRNHPDYDPAWDVEAI